MGEQRLQRSARRIEANAGASDTLTEVDTATGIDGRGSQVAREIVEANKAGFDHHVTFCSEGFGRYETGVGEWVRQLRQAIGAQLDDQVAAGAAVGNRYPAFRAREHPAQRCRDGVGDQYGAIDVFERAT